MQAGDTAWSIKYLHNMHKAYLSTEEVEIEGQKDRITFSSATKQMWGQRGIYENLLFIDWLIDRCIHIYDNIVVLIMSR